MRETRILQTDSLPFVQTIRRQFTFCRGIIVFRLVKITSSRTSCQRVFKKIDFKYATCNASSAGIFSQNLLKFLLKERKFSVLFITKATIQPSAWKCPKIAINPPRRLISQYNSILFSLQGGNRK